MRVSIVVAADENGLIGSRGTIPWHHPEDLKRFKAITSSHVVVMGRKTWESLPKKPLPNRINIVISSSPVERAIQASSLETAISWCQLVGTKELFIIGGGQVYTDALEADLVDRVFFTRIKGKYPAGEDAVYFPEHYFDLGKWMPRLTHEEGFVELNRTRKTLPRDVSRCYGEGCAKRDICWRHTEIFFDRQRGGVFPYTKTMLVDDNCDYFLEYKC